MKHVSNKLGQRQASVQNIISNLVLRKPKVSYFGYGYKEDFYYKLENNHNIIPPFSLDISSSQVRIKLHTQISFLAFLMLEIAMKKTLKLNFEDDLIIFIINLIACLILKIAMKKALRYYHFFLNISSVYFRYIPKTSLLACLILEIASS